MTFVPAVLITVGIAVLSLMESTHMPSVSVSDKILHGVMYALLASAWLIPVLLRVPSRVRTYLYVCVGVTMYGALIEVLQRFCTLTRSGDMADLLADFIGALLGVAGVAMLKWLNNKTTR
jgi:VanZ family protein